jgi:hypothetical protein
MSSGLFIRNLVKLVNLAPQNKFLNKEVLELNQLRQQAADREQKLFM